MDIPRRMRLYGKLVGAALLTTLSATGAAADPKARRGHPYVGLWGGRHEPIRDWQLGAPDRTPADQPLGGAELGARLGWHSGRHWAVEAGLAWLPLRSEGDGRVHVLRTDATLLWLWMAREWTPFLAVGGGTVHAVAGVLGRDTDPQGHIGIGVRGWVAPWAALRAELRDVITDGTDNGGAHNLALLLGIDTFPFRATHHHIRDRDGDGMRDDRDHCPDERGPHRRCGCPEMRDCDGDGIADSDDRCPAAPGLPAHRGCPQSRDGDNDGVADRDDACPAAAGAADLGGCPDRDGDRVPDDDDRCADVAGLRVLRGCPDSDRDGIADQDDRCPQQAGVASLGGCLPDAVGKFVGVVKGIGFDSSSDQLLPTSLPLLDELAALLVEFPQLHLHIDGHTDSSGDQTANHRLSHARADAVKAYLMRRGVAARRLEAEGWGDRRPLADNATEEGRARNRRIELTVVGGE